MKRLMIVIALVALLGALFAYGTFTPRNERDVESPRLGRKMPDFELPLFTRYHDEFGEVVRLAEFAGKPVVINFWASWCYPACYREAPHLEAAWQRYRGEVMFIGVDTQDTEERGREFLDQFKLSFPNGLDPRSRIGIDYGIFGIPETFFIRPDGTLSYRHTGEITLEQLERQIEVLLQ
jgi:cytochrome c biogenesis protein CcmG/thiol:disulfide interchange protein DsbE